MPRKTKVTIHNGIIMTRPPVVGHKRKVKDLDGSARSRKVSAGSLVILHKTRADACIEEWNQRYQDHPNSTPGQDKERIAQLLSIPITLQCLPECGKTIGLGTRQWSPTLLCSNLCPLRKFCEGAISEKVKAETKMIINQRNDKYFKGGCPIVPEVRPSLLKMTLDRVDLLKCLCEPKSSNQGASRPGSTPGSSDTTPTTKRRHGTTPNFEPEITVEEENDRIVMERLQLEPAAVNITPSPRPSTLLAFTSKSSVPKPMISSPGSDEGSGNGGHNLVVSKPVDLSTSTLKPMNIDNSYLIGQQDKSQKCPSKRKVEESVQCSISSQLPPLLYAERRSKRGADHSRIKRRFKKRKRTHTKIAKIKNPEDFRMLCIVELPWLKPSQHHYHIDIGITGWGKGEESETHWRTAVRETYEESLVDITLLCKQDGFRVIPVNICGRLNQKTFVCFAPQPFKESTFPIAGYRSLLSRSFGRIFESTLRLTTATGSSTALTPLNSSVTAEPPDGRTKRKHHKFNGDGGANTNLISQFSKPVESKTSIGAYQNSLNEKSRKESASKNQEVAWADEEESEAKVWMVKNPDLVCKYWLRNDCWRNAFCQYAHSKYTPQRFRFYRAENIVMGGGLPQEFISGRSKQKSRRGKRKKPSQDIILPPRGHAKWPPPPNLAEEEKTLAYIEPIPLRSSSVTPEPTFRSCPNSGSLPAPENRTSESIKTNPEDLSRLSFLCGPIVARLRHAEQQRRNSESESGASTPPCPNIDDDVEVIPFILRIRPRPWARRMDIRRSAPVDLNDCPLNRVRGSTLPDK